MDFSLEDFEASVLAGEWETSYQRLVRILVVLNEHNGVTDTIWVRYHPERLTPEESERYLASRIAQAIGHLFLSPGFMLSRPGFCQLMGLQRWISSLFAAGPTGNADHLIRLLGGVRADDPNALDVQHAHIEKICLLFTSESDLSLDAQALWARDPVVAANLLMALQTPRHMISENAWRKRKAISAWFPIHLAQLRSIEQLPWNVVHDVWMHSSYLSNPDKHEIKRAINGHCRQALIDAGCPQWEGDETEQVSDTDKPCIVVMLEWFHANHSVYRTHSESLRSLRKKYRLVGVGVPEGVDSAAMALFDSFHAFTGGHTQLTDLCGLARYIRSQNPCMIYYLGVGMFPYTIMLSNMRLAPIQMVALGHAASTFSSCMDYFLVDEDFAGQSECYSERVISLPQGVMPFARPNYFANVEPEDIVRSGKVRVAIPASAMKLNPEFMATLAQVAARCGPDCEFVFFPAFAKGLVYHELRKEVQRHLPEAYVHRHLSPQAYLKALSGCDVFLCPFPYGNMNSIVDTAVFGLAGVCMRGAQPHEAIDAGVFARLQRLDTLRVADSVESYVAQAVDLIQGLLGKERVHRFDPQSVASLYEPGPVSLADCVHELRQCHAKVKDSPLRVLRLGRRQPGLLASDLGLAHQATEQYEASLPHLDQAIAENPQSADYRFHRAVSLHHLNRFEEAIEGYQDVLDREPTYAAALSNLGLCLMEWNQPAKPLRHGDSSAPSTGEALELGQAYRQQNVEPALTLLQNALALEPQAPDAYLNAGVVLQALGRPQEALVHYAQCLRLNPQLANARFNSAIVHLSLGDYAQGWAGYESRWQTTRAGVITNQFSQPLWLGQAPLQGQRILLHAEQGLGDAIQFFRYVPWVKALGAVVICEVQAALKPLLSMHEGVDEWVSAGEPRPPFDWHCPLLSLPLALAAQKPGIPSPEGYLLSSPAKVSHWQARLGVKKRPRVGVVWRGNPGHKNDFLRSIDGSTLISHLPPGFDYVCLQKDIRPEEQAALAASSMRVVTDELHDMSDTAALCACMDVVVSVCSSVAHLAGALGRPTWIMLPHVADWRWLRERDDSPWYASVRLFRQDESCAWSPVLKRVEEALVEWRECQSENLATL